VPWEIADKDGTTTKNLIRCNSYGRGKKPRDTVLRNMKEREREREGERERETQR
jgi:hypothetical protein